MASRLLKDAKMLLPLPSSCPELLDALQHMERYLCLVGQKLVDQKPSKSTKQAMNPIVDALTAKELVRHHDADVNLLVLCCNYEILTIMIPDNPYNDEQTEDFYELATMTFEKSSSFVDVERSTRLTKHFIMFRHFKFPNSMFSWSQDNQIVRLFKQFLLVANSSAPYFVLEMEMIMTSIIQEFDDPEPMLELLRPLLMSVRKDSRARLAMFASPVCQELGERVLKNCAGLLKQYLPDIIRKLGIPLQDYSEIVAQICNGVTENEAMGPSGKQDTAQKIKLECTEGSNNTVQTVRHCQQATKHTINPSIANDPIICVQGYKVKKSIAPILEAIFMKYGDIAAECLFKIDCVRALFLELVCEVVTQLKTNDDRNIISKMNEIESKVSEAEAAKINVSWLRSHLEALKKSSLLMETKAKTSMLKTASEMDVIERREDLMAAQQRFEKAERCMKVLHLVEKKLNSNILDSKTKPIV